MPAYIVLAAVPSTSAVQLPVEVGRTPANVAPPSGERQIASSEGATSQTSTRSAAFFDGSTWLTTCAAMVGRRICDQAPPPLVLL